MSAHNGKTVRCRHDSTDEVDIDVDEEPTTLTFEDHGSYLQHPSGEDDRGTPLRERVEASILRFDCPTCGRRHFMCPVCSDPDDNSAPGWFWGESSGEKLACHNCNQQEAARQRRRSY